MKYGYDDYKNSAAYISGRLGGRVPEALLILGSGLGGLANEVEEPVYIPYEEVPNFKSSTAIGHMGRFVAGRLGGREVIMMQGRLHVYEGHSMEDVAYPVRTLAAMGVKRLVVTNAAGGVNASFHAGGLMLIKDYIKFTLDNPLMGENISEFGPRFPDMSYVFDREYMALFRDIAKANGEEVEEGSYFYMTGPMYETPAEIRAIRILGGDAVGMSTVPEVIAANHAGMRILGVTLIANMAAGMLDVPLSGEEVVAAGNAASARFGGYIREFIRRMP